MTLGEVVAYLFFLYYYCLCYDLENRAHNLGQNCSQILYLSDPYRPGGSRVAV